MGSGIGPKTTLEKFKIPILVARESVGQNMWDQVSISLFQQIDLESQSGLSDPSLAAAAAEKYIANRTGILTSNGADFIGKCSSRRIDVQALDKIYFQDGRNSPLPHVPSSPPPPLPTSPAFPPTGPRTKWSSPALPSLGPLARTTASSTPTSGPRSRAETSPLSQPIPLTSRS